MFLQNSVLVSDIENKYAIFWTAQAAVLYVNMILPWNTWLPLGL